MRGSNSIQQASKKKKEHTSSEWFGVTWSKQKNKWLAKTTINYKTKSLGLFDDERQAAKAYIINGMKRFGWNFRKEDQKKLGFFQD